MPYLNLPFGVVALGLVLRGFAGFFLERENALQTIEFAVPQFGTVVISPGLRLGLFVVAGLVVSLVGVKIAADVSDETLDEEMVE
jgi:putative membrane protein